MSEALWIVLIVSILSTLSVWGKAFFDYKSRKALVLKNKKNGFSSNPGHPCGAHAEAIKNLKTEFKEFKENNRDDHEKIFDKIDDIWKSL